VFAGAHTICAINPTLAESRRDGMSGLREIENFIDADYVAISSTDHNATATPL